MFISIRDINLAIKNSISCQLIILSTLGSHILFTHFPLSVYREDGLFAFLCAHTASSLPKYFLIRLNRPLTQIKEEYFCLAAEHILWSLGLNNCVVAVSPRYFKPIFL